MAAYLIVELEVDDKEAFARYQSLAAPWVGKFGGRALFVGGREGSEKTESVEGNWMPERLAVVEFADMQSAKNFYYSPEYQAALKLRMASARSKMIFVEGRQPL